MRRFLLLSLLFAAGAVGAVPPPMTPPTHPPAPLLSADNAAAAEGNYQRYCALCHGDQRQGHANDDAPSLRSQSLLESTPPRIMIEAIAYGRPGTPMAGFLDEIGGPMTYADIVYLNMWLKQQAGVTPVPLQGEVSGDAANGAEVYAANCAGCHGANGEGGTGTALANPTMLALTSDGFLRHAIVNGRQDTPMPAFGATLGEGQINDVVAFLRSRASAWIRPAKVTLPPALDSLVINAGARPPTFELRDGLYVSAAQLRRELDAKKAMVLLDTRVPSVWQIAHIEGAAPLPFYSGAEVLATLPRDGTWIVAYCECPRAAAESVVRRLRAEGFLNTAVLYEGFQGWIALGHPVVSGEAPPGSDPAHDHAH
jgi:cytochrome c oxidase cbb3-type subunit 3